MCLCPFETKLARTFTFSSKPAQTMSTDPLWTHMLLCIGHVPVPPPSQAGLQDSQLFGGTPTANTKITTNPMTLTLTWADLTNGLYAN